MDCSAEVRMKGHFRVLKELLPDVLGGQEVNKDMQPLFMLHCQEEKLPYTMIWGNFTPIFYRSDRLELIDHEFLLYPRKVEGFDGKFNDAKSKGCNIAVFRCKENQKLFVFGTTHLWWENDAMTAGSAYVRMLQVKSAIEQMERFGAKYGPCPLILVGDMNDVFHSPCIDYAINEAGFTHAYHAATEFCFEGMGYNNCNGNGPGAWWNEPFERAIDHILVRDLGESRVLRFDRYCPDYYLSLSDHAPAYIDFEL